ncbi:SusC/RagA family TonB-linked outer membrane protein [Pedobacter sp. BMA]|uniref:SusC/RagA family TonB-linked outer membrane protein n=1 Tax=Pedobacter sp. BMA TaxID=1663685 RepID=UPI00064AE05E|nr:SusC/RagA family TonB-linked outer membrane protein [Pedobacter sp. BMA]KLT64732.1 hypothetical protein AB669_13360 [Pedobacter sp. BMA]
MRTKLLILLALNTLIFNTAYAQDLLKGQVISAMDNKPLSGVTVWTDFRKKVTTNQDGIFILPVNNGTKAITLFASCTGYIGYHQEIKLPNIENLLIRMAMQVTDLQEVTVNTGYNKVAKERATGSFVQVDHKLLERSVSTNILDRLKDVVPGLIFNKTKGLAAGETSIGIRGQSTLLANSQPLIVLDNFPYDGDVANINPNDMESITVLKDAAAASIWGARAANGVIVLTSKRGKKGQSLVINTSVNYTLLEQPDLTKNQAMTSGEFIEIERLLFTKGFYSATESSVVKAPLSPAVELFIANRDGTLSNTDLNNKLAQLSNIDLRRQYMKYLGQDALLRQHALSISGSTGASTYLFSAGFDANRLSDQGNSYQRLTLNFNDRISMLKDRLSLDLKLMLTRSVNSKPNDGYTSLRMSSTQILYPYAQLVDDDGNSLSVVKDFRQSFTDAAAGNGYLDWTYKPAEDYQFHQNNAEALDYRFNTVLTYKVVEGLTAEASFQFGKLGNQESDLNSLQSYFTRNLINRFSQVTSGQATVYPLPKGAILDRYVSTLRTINFRGQLNYRKELKDFELNALAGYEWRDLEGSSYTNRFYGYNELNGTNTVVDYIGSYPMSYYNPSTSTIPSNDAVTGTIDRFLSYYTNASLAYKAKYTISGSWRLDQSNLFGVNTNQKGVPLWSVGGLWNIGKESFYNVGWLPTLRLRLTYGYNGNIDKNLSALTTARYFSTAATLTRLPYAVVLNPPNPELRWERVKVINLGIDFGFAGNRISGSIEGYTKKGIDLIADIPFAPSTGITLFRGNVANTSVKGIDFTLNTINTRGIINWNTNFWLSYTHEKVTGYSQNATTAIQNLTSSADAGAYPRQRYPLYAMFSYRYAGLNASGEPQGYLNGVPSTNYTAIMAATSLDDLVYSGSAKPVVFGSLMNTAKWKAWSLSANISYRLGYYVRKNSVNYATVLAGQGGNSDYALRWKQPGDELNTIVPKIPDSYVANRENLYLYSDALVFRGDHIRLQDIRLAFDLSGKPKYFFSNLQVFAYASNLGIIWKANKWDIDPDYQGTSASKTFSLGVKINL